MVGAGPLDPARRRCAGRALGVSLAAARVLRAAAAPLRARAAGARRASTSSLTWRSSSRTAGTAIHRRASARLSAGTHESHRTGSTARSGANADVAVLWTGEPTAVPGLGERVLQPQRQHGLRRRRRPRCPTPARDRRSPCDASGVMLDAAARPVPRAVRARRRQRRSSSASAGRSRPAIGLDLYRVNGPLVILDARPGLYRTTPGRAARSTYQRVDVHRRHARGARCRATRSSSRAPQRSSRSRGRRRRSSSGVVRDRRTGRSSVPLAGPRTASAASSSPFAARARPVGRDPGPTIRHAPARAAPRRVRLPPP